MPSTLLFIFCFFAIYGFFHFAKDIGKRLKRQREAQEEAHKVIKEHGQESRNGTAKRK